MLKSNFKFFILTLFVLGLLIAGAYTFLSHPGDAEGDVDPLQTTEPAAPSSPTSQP
ncbi:hypothetical protein [Limoniibacter endophyticus]|uniref:Uncharacterized protein n=1 Tax=Limoniibacter endophyticus TaxID=1565040 RepID=A0A8J3GF80_9HYPH|nr:hypothetical protein [Limoniibacter endophyticus]GHC60984.1 hypothetical protein GCM10010136_01320 [Limoniibacter endophyticus]